MTRNATFDPVTTMAKRLCVDAGAGSGKTTVLIARILHLLEQGLADLDRIVAITFTDAAAAEMKIRLRREFHRKAPADNPAEMSRWRELERRVDSARLSTIHAFCAGLMRENALRVGRDPEFAVLTDAEAVLLRDETIEETLHDLLDREMRLDAGEGPATRAATELGMSPLARELDAMINRRRLVGLIQEGGLPPDPEALAAHWLRIVNDARRRHLLALRRSRRLRGFRRVLEKLGGACSSDRDAREAGRLFIIAAIDRIGAAEDPTEIEAILRDIVDIGYRGGPTKNRNPEEFEKLKAAQKEVKDFAEKHIPPDIDPAVETRAAALAADICQVYARLAEAYRTGKSQRASADFDDLIQAAYEMLRDNDEIRARTARGIRFLLIDEFQDTDSWQLDIARLLADHPDGPDLFIVGDAKQSIYDFRGAEVEVFQREKEGGRTTALDTNYRTVTDVLAFINETFERSGLLEAVEPQYAPLIPNRPALDERRIEFLLPPRQPGKTPVNEYRSSEAAMIAQRLDAMVRGVCPALVCDRNQAPRPAQFGDIAILFRAMSNVYLYEEALRRRNIPYNVVAGRGFFQRQEIVDLRNLLTVLVDPWDQMALLGFLRGPIAGVSDEALVRLAAGGGLLQNFYSGDTLPGFTEPAPLEHARALVTRLRARSSMPLPAFLRFLLDDTGCEAIALSQFLGLQKACNVRKVIDLAADFARTRPATLAAFLRYLDQAALDEVREGDATLQPEGAGTVTLMSIHKSKGLEFPIVVVADVSREPNSDGHAEVVALHRDLGLGVRIADRGGDSVSPAICSAIKREQAEKDEAEQARMLYVAMTRARDWLLLSGSPDANKNSWMRTFNDLYGVCEAEDGCVIRGESPGWSAVVRRECPTDTAGWQPPVSGAIGPVAPPEDLWRTLARRAEPVNAAASARKTFSVAEILDRITDTFDPDEYHDDQRPPDADACKRMFRGALVHRMFELWNTPGEPPIDAVLASERMDPALGEELRPSLLDIASRFQVSPLAPRFFAAEGNQREVPFHLNTGGALVHGRIDAMLEDGAVVLDYKTGRPGGHPNARYEFQLRLYTAAIWRLLGTCPQEALLYYADHGVVRSVDISPEAIADVLERVQEAITEWTQPPRRVIAP